MGLLLSVLLLVSGAFAKTFNNRIVGEYPVTDLRTLLSAKVKYKVLWNESDQEITGYYFDALVNRNPVPLIGSKSPEGVTLKGIFTTPFLGFSYISIVIKTTTKQQDVVPVDFQLSSQYGAQTGTIISAAEITQADSQEQTTCLANFGELAEYCGLYKGSIAETQDTQGICNLQIYEAKLTLNENSKLTLQLGNFQNNLGSIPLNPTSTFIELESRNCGQPSSTQFPIDSCQSIKINGTFSKVGETKSFTGTYTIQDEISSATCIHQLTLTSSSVMKVY